MSSAPVFFASDVAALLGRHRYRTKHEALLKFVSNKPVGLAAAEKDADIAKAFARLQADKLAMQEVQLLKSTVDALCEEKRLSPSAEDMQVLQEQAQASAQTLRVAAETSERAASEATQAVELSKDATAVKAQSAEQEVREAVLLSALPEALPEVKLPEVCEALDAVERGAADAKQMQVAESVHAKVPTLRPAMEKARRRVEAEAEPELERLVQVHKRARSAATEAQSKHSAVAQLAEAPAALQQLVEQQVNKQRGAQEEEQVLAKTEAQHQTPITNRNERRGFLVEQGFCIAGYCDGFMEAENRIVEVKKRRNWFKLPPEYDLVQLRVYMRMFGAASGLLVESQLNGPQHRETLIESDELEWGLIRTGLQAAASEIREATPTSIRAWALSMS